MERRIAQERYLSSESCGNIVPASLLCVYVYVCEWTCVPMYIGTYMCIHACACVYVYM